MAAPPAAIGTAELAGRPFFASWSGGKDSCLALWRAVRAGGRPVALVTMLAEDGARSRSHGLAAGVLRAQAESLGLPVLFRATMWAGYEAAFLDAAGEAKRLGAAAGVFGDIEIAEHRAWVERVSARAGLAACEPLWAGEPRALLAEFLGAGFEARITAVREHALEARFLGRGLSPALADEIAAAGADPCGERGEYHTVVTAGPLFARPVRLAERGRAVHAGVRFLELALAEEK
jgi:uncharacterized protein (TIGR00290 family)